MKPHRRTFAVLGSATLWSLALVSLFTNGVQIGQPRIFNSYSDMMQAISDISGVTKEQAMGVSIRFVDLGDTDPAKWSMKQEDAVDGRAGVMLLNSRMFSFRGMTNDPLLFAAMPHEDAHMNSDVTSSPLLQTIKGILNVNDGRGGYGGSGVNGKPTAWRADEVLGNTVSVEAQLFLADQAFARGNYDDAKMYADEGMRLLNNTVEPLKKDVLYVHSIATKYSSTDELTNLSAEVKSSDTYNMRWIDASFTTADGKPVTAKVWFDNYNNADSSQPVKITLDITATSPEGRQATTTYKLGTVDKLDPKFTDGSMSPTDILGFAMSSAKDQASAIYDLVSGPISVKNDFQSDKLSTISVQSALSGLNSDFDQLASNPVIFTQSVDAMEFNSKINIATVDALSSLKQDMGNYSNGIFSLDGMGGSSPMQQSFLSDIQVQNALSQDGLQLPMEMGGLDISVSRPNN